MGSYFYSFSSGDLLNPDATVTYRLGRIDFSGGVPIPTVLTSGDNESITVGAFSHNNKTYLYSSKINKKDTSTTTMTTTYTVYDPDKPLNGQINTATPHKLVSLAPDRWTYLYVWSSKKTNVSADGSYDPISSDIHVYDRDSLTKLATFSNVRTGFDTTKQKADDENSLEMGRGLVYIAEKFLAYVAYDTSDSSDANLNSAHIVKIDETNLTSSVIVSSADIGGRNIDIESPMPDLKGGIYFEAYSKDANPNEPASRDSYVYHWTSSSLVSLDVANGKSNGELVIDSGKYSGDIMVYVLTSNTSNDKVYTYLWDGTTRNYTYQIDDGTVVGVEIEKPFSDGADGLYFMAERKIESGNANEAYEADGFWWWEKPGATVTEVWESTSELEIEAPELDANNGFYFVNASADIGETKGQKSDTTTMTLHYCVKGKQSFVADLGSFDVPPSTFIKTTADPYATPKEKLQDEYLLLADDEYDLMLAAAGPVGGKFKMTVFDYSKKDTRALTSADIIEPVFTDEDMGGYADLAGAQKFTDAVENISSSSSSGCNAGFTSLFALLGFALMKVTRKK